MCFQNSWWDIFILILVILVAAVFLRYCAKKQTQTAAVNRTPRKHRPRGLSGRQTSSGIIGLLNVVWIMTLVSSSKTIGPYWLMSSRVTYFRGTILWTKSDPGLRTTMEQRGIILIQHACGHSTSYPRHLLSLAWKLSSTTF